MANKIKNIRYIVHIEGLGPRMGFWKWYFTDGHSNNETTLEFISNAKNDLDAVQGLNQRIRYDGRELTDFREITDWRIIKHWIEVDDAGREASKCDTIQEYFKYGGKLGISNSNKIKQPK